MDPCRTFNVVLLSSIGTSIANVSLPTLAQAFGASFQQVQWVVLAYLPDDYDDGGQCWTARRHHLGISSCLHRVRVLLFTVASALCGGAASRLLIVSPRRFPRSWSGHSDGADHGLSRSSASQSQGRQCDGELLLRTMPSSARIQHCSGGLSSSHSACRRVLFLVDALAPGSPLMQHSCLPMKPAAQANQPRFDLVGTMLATTLAAYALAMTVGRGTFGMLAALGLLVAALIGIGLFIIALERAGSPLIRLAMFRNALLSASLAMSSWSRSDDGDTGGWPFYSLANTRATQCGLVWTGVVDCSSVCRIGRSAGRSPRGRRRRRPHDPYGTHRDFGGSLLSHSGVTGDCWLHPPHRRHHSRLCVVPDGQQHGCDDGRSSRPAGASFPACSTFRVTWG